MYGIVVACHSLDWLLQPLAATTPAALCINAVASSFQLCFSILAEAAAVRGQ